MTRRVLLTGADGFIGSHCLDHFLATTDWQVVCVNSWSHGGFAERIVESHFAQHRDRVEIHTHDLALPLSDLLLRRISPIDAVVHFAAESHVDTSIQQSRMVVENNVACTLTVLEAARILKPEIVIQISTDEVYGPAEGDDSHPEWSPLLPSNPYSGSKAAQEVIAHSYWRTHGVPVVITNGMNSIGERQPPEKFLPMVIRRVLRGEHLDLHASPDRREVGSRNYLHARNHADACRWLIERGRVGQFPAADRPDRWNIPGQSRLSNLVFAQRVAGFIGKPLLSRLVDGNTGRPGHDLHYGLDGSKITAAGWNHPVPFDAALEKTVQWYLRNLDWLELAP